ncbi:hypothetical protein RHSIM_Rhsim03G0220600 [Rhododendron simsii]|uniref:PWWP domain-containing protein n=1 Tax=Rhododendron simsii TaxID=118357 RepID=A0A834H704_RHOSS|nr:hypothetical protein RHSIM_Rhsim03G0220600 [Rhododendron simsii]
MGAVVDCSVGAVVWVRRRNGSWWPGTIVGPEELSGAHDLMSPRSGTPVKLLGREDATVDWYNLEKSKRVKAFRCGEFDDCIERAESSIGMLPNKREKYARREDAILHALELEKKLLGGKYSKLGCSSNSRSSKSSDPVEKALVSPSECLGKDSGKHVHPKSHSKKLDSPMEDKSMDHPLHAQKVKEGRLLDRDEDNSEIIPWRQGLQNIGLKISHSNQKLASSVASNGSRKPGFDNSPENTVHANNITNLDHGMKSNEVFTYESLVRRRDGRRPLDQVLQSTAYLTVHRSRRHDNDNVPMLMSEEKQTGVILRAKRGRFVDLPRESINFSDDRQFCTNHMEIQPSQIEESTFPHPGALDEETASENTGTDSSETDSVDSDADEEIVAPDAAAVTGLETKSPGGSGTQVPYASISSEEPDDSALTSDVSHLSRRDPVGVSKWKLEGKRNNCGVSKRATEVSRSSMCGTNLEERGSNSWGEPDLTENNLGAFDNQGSLLASNPTSEGLDDFTHKIIDWEDFSLNDPLVVKGSWEEDSSNYNYFDPVLMGCGNSGGRMKSMLVDVDLKVQSNYQREHVPLISLMSESGNAIVGYPIQIEALENGASEVLLSVADGEENDDTEEPLRRTARRTAVFRVRHQHPLAELDGEDYGHKPIRCPLDRRYSRKQPKKKSIKKIRALSSIGTKKKLKNNLRECINNFKVDEQIKGESGPTAVTCIPVKLVFSRLYEELVGRLQ